MRIARFSNSIGPKQREDFFKGIRIHTGTFHYVILFLLNVPYITHKRYNVFHQHESLICSVYSTHVLTEDTIAREVKDGKLYTKRLLTKTNRVPKWGERFISKNIVKIVEESIVDPQTKTMTTYTRNLGYTKVMVS